MLSGKPATPSADRTAPDPDNGWLSRPRGSSNLRWFGLVAEPLPTGHDELARQSLTTDHPTDDLAHWIF